MLSGVGPKEELQRHGIPLLQDLPGVGQNLQDHPDFVFVYKTSSLDAMGVSFAGSTRMLKEAGRFRRERRGMLTSNFAEGGAFLKTREGLDKPDIQLHFVVAPVEDHARKLRLGHWINRIFNCILLSPRSRTMRASCAWVMGCRATFACCVRAVAEPYLWPAKTRKRHR
ncbi:Alcohol dehydrogenase [acceptor] [compost metagenome]